METANFVALKATQPDYRSPVPGWGFLGLGDQSAAVSCATVHALNMLTGVATAVGATATASKYQTAAGSMAASVNKNLWNSTLGAYSLSITTTSNYSFNAASFCINSGVVNTTRAVTLMETLANLKHDIGFLDTTSIDPTDPNTIVISPDTNGFLLGAMASQTSIIMSVYLTSHLL